jgi:DNA invertase Pin-like site-specific DNA recombinase
MKKVAIYARVSTDKQTTQNQIDALREVAERCGYQILKSSQRTAYQVLRVVKVVLP